MQNRMWVGAVAIAGSLFFAGVAAAQSSNSEYRVNREPTPQVQRLAQTNPTGQTSDSFTEQVNANVVTIISATPSGTWLPMTHDMSAVLDNGNNLRVIPMVGKGSAQNIRDILYLRGVDMGIVQANILRYFEKTGEAGRNIGQRLRYITRLHSQEIHIIGQPGVETIRQLEGKVVNFADAGSGTQITAQLLFESLGLRVTEVNMGQNDAFEKMKSGEIEATILSAGKPAAAFTKIKAEDGFRFVPIPYEGPVQNDFVPATFSHDDYPSLIAKGQTVDTIAETAVLISFNWAPNTERYRRVANFTKAFFENFDKFLQTPRHPKWKEVNLAATLPGWQRFSAAEELLKTVEARKSSPEVIRQDFNNFLTSLSQTGTVPANDRDRERLFREFMEWRQSQGR